MLDIVINCLCHGHIVPKKNILKSNNFGVMQTVFFAFTCKFGLCLHVEKVVICINKTNWHPLPKVLKNWSSCQKKMVITF